MIKDFFKNKLLPFLIISFSCPGLVLAAGGEWVSLVPEGMFDGIQSDLLVAVGGILSLVLIVVGLGVLIKAFLN